MYGTFNVSRSSMRNVLGVFYLNVFLSYATLLYFFLFQKKEKAGAKQERRPFNRETDLKANVFDDAQKKAIYKKAQLLDSRFSRGETKYL